MNWIGRFFQELQRRQMVGVVAIYVFGAWGIVEVADTDVVQDMFGVDPGFVLLAAIIGFPFAAVTGWFYDITKQGIYRTPPADADDSFDSRLKIRDVVFLAAMLVVWAVAVYVVHTPPVQERSIALVVFEGPELDKEIEEFAVNLRNDLHEHLGRVATFLSISPDSVDKVNRSWPIFRVAEHLGVAYVLTGTIDRIGDVAVVSPRLVDGRSGSILWIPEQPFDREPTLDARYDIRSAIATGISNALGKKLSARENEVLARRPTVSREASDAYIRGRTLLRRRQDEALVLAAAQFEKAIELDSVFAEAYAELAITLMLVTDEFELVERGYDEANRLIDRAMELDPHLAEAHAARGFYLWGGKGEIDAALESLRQAIELNPTYEPSYHWMAAIYRQDRGEHEAAFRITENLARRSPYQRNVFWTQIGELLARGRIQEAEQRVSHMRIVDALAADWSQQDIDALNGNWASELIWALKLHNEWPGRMHYILTWTLVAVGFEEEAKRLVNSAGWLHDELIVTIGDHGERMAIVESLTKEYPEPDDPNSISAGVALAAVGDYKRARPYLETWWRGWNQVAVGDALIAQALIAARRDAGDLDGAAKVIEALKKNVRRLRAAGIYVTSRAHSVDYVEGMASYLAGERENGLELIAKAAKDGFFILPPEAFAFQFSLAKEPEFVRILENQAKHQAREREKVLKVVCKDNPYPDAWTPLNETCESHR